MNNLLCAIQKFPSAFVYSLQRRSSTTPSEYNRNKHNDLIEKIRTKDWKIVESIINEEAYYNALEGVVMCLRTTKEFTASDNEDTYYDELKGVVMYVRPTEEFTSEDYENILDLYKDRKLS